MSTCATLLLCLMPSLYVEQGVSKMFPIRQPPPGHAYRYDRTEAVNPYSVTELGAEWVASRRFRVTLVGRHVSSIKRSDDAGDNSMEFRVRYYLRVQQ